jgi:hypothetical protein
MSLIYIKEICSENHLITIRVDGMLDSNSMPTLQSACECHLREDKIVELDLRNLLHISREGRIFLKEMESKGVRMKYPRLIV